MIRYNKNYIELLEGVQLQRYSIFECIVAQWTDSLNVILSKKLPSKKTVVSATGCFSDCKREPEQVRKEF